MSNCTAFPVTCPLATTSPLRASFKVPPPPLQDTLPPAVEPVNVDPDCVGVRVRQYRYIKTLGSSGFVVGSKIRVLSSFLIAGRERTGILLLAQRDG